MTVRCPDCGSEQPSIEAAIGLGGAMTQCRRCGLRWLARPYEGVLPLSFRADDVSDAVVLDEAPQPRRSLPRRPPERGLVPGAHAVRLDRRMIAAAVAFGALALFGVLWSPIVSALPEATQTAALTDPLEIRKVRSEVVNQGGVSTLFVEGEIVNLSSGHVALPAVVITMRSASGAAIGSWRVDLAAGSLPAGRSVGFRSALAAPPADASEVTLSIARPAATPL